MNYKPIISLIIRLLITTIFLLIFFLFFAFVIIMANFVGGETIQQIENQNLMILVISFIFTLPFIYIGYHHYIHIEYFKSIGISFVPTIVLLISIGYFGYNYNYRTELNPEIWKSTHSKPSDMAISLEKGNTLIGLNRKEVKELLGNGNRENRDIQSDRGFISYSVEENWTLTIYFKYNIVQKTELRLPFMMT